MKFTLKIDSNNEAMVDLPDLAVADMLVDVARKLRAGSDVGVLRDVNGQPVGNWKLTVSKR